MTYGVGYIRFGYSVGSDGDWDMESDSGELVKIVVAAIASIAVTLSGVKGWALLKNNRSKATRRMNGESEPGYADVCIDHGNRISVLETRYHSTMDLLRAYNERMNVLETKLDNLHATIRSGFEKMELRIEHALAKMKET